VQARHAMTTNATLHACHPQYLKPGSSLLLDEPPAITAFLAVYSEKNIWSSVSYQTALACQVSNLGIM